MSIPEMGITLVLVEVYIQQLVSIIGRINTPMTVLSLFTNAAERTHPEL